MDGSGVKLSIVMPAYNEERTIGAALDEVVAQVVPVVPSAEIIVVDDGSVDATARIVADRAATDPRIRYIHQENAGHGPAVHAGLGAARGESVLLLDSDCQVALNDFSAHWREFEGRQAVLGVRVPRYDGWHRTILSMMMKGLVSVLFRVSPVDAGTPFKLVRMRHWIVAKQWIDPSNPIPAVLLAIYLVNNGGDVVQRRVVHRPRLGSASTLKPIRLFKFCSKGVAAIARFRLAASWK